MKLYKHICICQKCGKSYEVECTNSAWEKGKYRKTCSSKCANSRNLSEIQKEHIRQGVKRYNKNKIKQTKTYQYICDKCGETFITNTRIRKDRPKHCEKCKQHRVHYKTNIENLNLTDLSKRTISKILKRSNACCSICNWNESSCDTHHVIPKSKGGTNEQNNLIIVCPNCHRIIHTTNRYNIEYLQTLTIDKTFTNWRDFYHIKN